MVTKMNKYLIGVGLVVSFLLVSKLLKPLQWLKKLKLRLIEMVMDKTLDKLTKTENGPCEIGKVEKNGEVYRYFKNAPSSLGELYLQSEKHRDKEFIIYKDSRSTFNDVMLDVAALEQALIHGLKVKKGDRVSILMANISEFATAFAAVTSCGAIACTLNAFWAGDMIKYGLDDSASTILIADEKRLARLVNIGVLEELMKKGLQVIVVRTGEVKFPTGTYCFHTLVKKYQDPSVDPFKRSLPKVSPNDVACIMYTSGTTSGKPKGVVLSHLAMVQATYSFVLFSELLVTLRGPNKVPRSDLITSPLFHASQFSSHFLLAFIHGTKLVLLPRWNADSASEIIVKEQITYLGLMPTMLGDLLNSKTFLEVKDKTCLTNVGTGGAPCPSELMKRLKDMIPSVSQGSGWGLTEVCAIATAIGGPAYLEYFLSCGKPHRIVDIKVVDPESGKDIVEPNKDGELCIRTVCVMDGYWGLRGETKETMYPGGWIRSGDIGHVNQDGYVFITDRLKELVIRGGENVSCCEVEDVIFRMDKSLKQVVEVSVFGLPHERYGEQLCAAVCLADAHHADFQPQKIKAFVKNHLASFKVPSQVFVRDAKKNPLPRGATGKVLKRMLKSEYVKQIE